MQVTYIAKHCPICEAESSPQGRVSDCAANAAKAPPLQHECSKPEHLGSTVILTAQASCCSQIGTQSLSGFKPQPAATKSVGATCSASKNSYSAAQGFLLTTGDYSKRTSSDRQKLAKYSTRQSRCISRKVSIHAKVGDGNGAMTLLVCGLFCRIYSPQDTRIINCPLMRYFQQHALL